MAEDKLHQRVSIESDAVGTQELASQGINEKRSQLFSTFGQQNIADTVWSVVVEPKDGKPVTGEGKTYQDAYAQATSSIPQDQIAKYGVKVTEHYDLPCARMSAKASGKSKATLLENLTREVEAIQSKVGAHFVKDELSVSYAVTGYSGGWKGRAEKPQGSVLGTGKSNKTVEEAEQHAIAQAGDKTPRGKVYEGVHEFNVITAGMSAKEISDLFGTEAAAVAAPAVPADSSRRSSSRVSSKPSGACNLPQSTPVYEFI